ncbi:MAG: hypothetical protein AVDCRST_MAG19-4691 [uncultured Thermomicrobiales bacterium]|uniref:Uncharacterized protein n=1 Tax=uncultured Thermomicrobiales bacterium TaxID=1645740 RepID=A0A6J4VQV4_9BACT|nr:MAG: hypothetical protein AVDCRST_MAG19-4691 [uncultured Thermomicrobiales bacterium]
MATFRGAEKAGLGGPFFASPSGKESVAPDSSAGLLGGNLLR